MTVEKLRRVKERLYNELGKGELESTEYWQTTYRFLYDECIVQGPFYEDDTREVTVRIATALLPKIPAIEYHGLERRYITRRDVGLSEQAQEDLDRFLLLRSLTRECLKVGVGDKPILRSEFWKMAESYLMNNTELPRLTTEKNQREVVVRIVTHLEGDFKIQEEPRRIGRYDFEGLERALRSLK